LIVRGHLLVFCANTGAFIDGFLCCLISNIDVSENT
jgi:hypothetical protein